MTNTGPFDHKVTILSSIGFAYGIIFIVWFVILETFRRGSFDDSVCLNICCDIEGVWLHGSIF